MRYKKIMMLAILLVSLLAVSVVSAEDNVTNDVVSVEKVNDEFVSIANEDINETTILIGNSMSIEDNSEIDVSKENKLSASAATFTDLANDIANAGDELNLTKDYVYSSVDSNYIVGIDIDKKITINGNGHLIDGNDKASAFKILYDCVVLNNITFKNCKTKGSSGGTIMWEGNNGTLSNCSFVSCSSVLKSTTYDSVNFRIYGSVIYWYGSNGVLSNCKISECSGSLSIDSSDLFPDTYVYGGAVYWYGSNGTLRDCSFVNCSSSANTDSREKTHGYTYYCNANSYGGAVYWYGSNGVLSNCSFVSCSSLSHCSAQHPAYVASGGAVYWYGSNGTLRDCSFVNCNVPSSQHVHGGAVSWSGSNGVLSNSTFDNCHILSDGCQSVFWSGKEGYVVDCNFVRCSSKNNGAICWDSTQGTIVNCMSDNKLVEGDVYVLLYESLIKLIMVNETNFGETVILNTIVSNGATGTINVLVDGIYKNSIVVGESLALSDLDAGDHTIMVIYNGDMHYANCMDMKVLKVKKVSTSISSSAVKTVYNGGQYLTATLKDAWKNPLKGVKVTIEFSNGKIATSTTDKNGQVKVSTNGLAPIKTYSTKITFAGNKNYVKSTKTINVKVTKATPKLTAKAKTFKKTDKTKKYTVTLKTNQNKVMKNTKLTLKVNGKTYSATTNAKGQATFKITKLTKKGKFTGTIAYKGNAYYNKLSKKVKITIK